MTGAHAIHMEAYGPPDVLRYGPVVLPQLAPVEVGIRTIAAAAYTPSSSPRLGRSMKDGLRKADQRSTAPTNGLCGDGATSDYVKYLKAAQVRTVMAQEFKKLFDRST
jgi:hypothetical protein